MSLNMAWLAFGVALAGSLVLTPLVRRFALRAGALDQPGVRSVHTRPVPSLGGIAIFLAVLVALAAVGLRSGGWYNPHLLGILAGGALITAVGIWDDVAGLPAWGKFLGQLVAAGVLLAFGVQIHFLTDPWSPQGMIALGSWGAPLTIFWVVAVVNTVNLADGLDGLAAGIGVIAALTQVVAAFYIGESEPIPLMAAMGGAALGFLRYNFHPARIFMGDTGSLFLGFTLAAAAVDGTVKSPTTIALVVPILVLGLPIFDTTFALFRRLRRGQPFYRPDREHLHHRLLAAGLSQRQAVLLMYLVTAGLGVAAILLARNEVWAATVLLVVILGGGLLAAGRRGLLAAGGRHRLGG
ncbi:MAG: MraY family glycosyltransferase [Thermaerobacter sp.]|jgi:UDP-GlcNAc:undecaprenyl-phosphate GlcNAc-1-phosphate transferase|nr:MraY family glycosyltransferase [Thermaerobacter sp.]MDA8145148.1 MraY family glycosyltransferase [Thermaerobacter sp.]